MSPESDGERVATLRTVLEKRPILAALDSAAVEDLRGLVDATEYSRSTVNRTVNDLEAMGLLTIRRSASRHTYELTFLGRRLLALVDCGHELLAARAMFEAVPAEADLPPWIVDDASIEVGDGNAAPHHVFDQIFDAVSRADRVHIVAPVLTRDVSFTSVAEQIFAGELTAELVFPQAHLDAVTERFGDRMERLFATDDVSVRSLGDETVPCGLGICYREHDDSRQAREVGLVCYDERRTNATGTLVSDSPPAIAWAERTFADYRDRARPVRPTE